MLFVLLLVVGCKKSSGDISLNDGEESMDFTCETGEFSITRAMEGVDVSDLSISLFAYASSDANSIYINNAQLVQDSSTWTLLLSEDESAEWPESGTVDFFAYSPISESYSAAGDATNRGLTITDYQAISDVKSQEDLMVAYATGYSSGTVPLIFEHQLSCISFGIIQSSGTDNTTYSITEISLEGVYSTADLVVDSDGDGEWGNYSSSQTYTISVDNELIPASQSDYALYPNSTTLKVVNTTDGYMKLIPQTLTSAAKFKATVVSSTDSQPYSVEWDLEGVEWSANEHYIYTLTFGAKDVTFSSITVSQWEQQDESSLDESAGVVNMHLYDDLDDLESVLNIFSYFNIRNISVLGNYFDGCIGDMSYTVDLPLEPSSFYSYNSPYIDVLRAELEILDLSGVIYSSDVSVTVVADDGEESTIIVDYTSVTSTPEMAFSPGFTYSSDKTFKAYLSTPLHTVLLPEHLTTIGNFAFAVSAVEQAVYANITDVGAYAFVSCTSLRNVVLEKANKIGDYAFYNCTLLKNVALPSSVELGSCVFDGVDTESCDLTLSGSSGVSGNTWGEYTWKSITTN
ncbi:MAG: fimbrillin family protein [Rikenellaceae bacterium]